MPPGAIVAVKSVSVTGCRVETDSFAQVEVPLDQLELKQEPKQDEELPLGLRFRIALDIAKGMRVLAEHQPPIVHRDLRPANVFVTSTNKRANVVAKVADFGLARFVDNSNVRPPTAITHRSLKPFPPGDG